jgi:hypothetical protein
MQLEIEIHSDRRWSYANAGTKRPLVKMIILKQDGTLPDRDIKIVPRVSLDFSLPEPAAEVWTAPLPRTIERNGSHIGETIEWEKIDLKMNYPLLGRIQQKVKGVIRVEIVDVDNGNVLATATQDLDLLAPNEFRFELDYWDPIAAFVFPTDPFVLEIMQKARQILHERTGDSSTEGYQSTPARVQEIANAIYDAMCLMGYDYSNPQGYFESGAQRVRTPSQIKQENCATCLDSAVLMASCISQAGLEPVVFIITGHAFVGYFTGRPIAEMKIEHTEDRVNYWLGLLRQNRITQLTRSQLGVIRNLLINQHIQPVETTTTTRGLHSSFDEACQRQNNFSVNVDPITGTDDSELQAIVIVQLAWQSGMTPPVALNDKALPQLPGWKLREIPEVVKMPDDVVLVDPALSPQERAIPPRIRQWMSSLLDLSSRNPLLKIKPTQLMEFDLPGSIIGKLDDLLHMPKGRIKLPSFTELPTVWVHNGVTQEEFDDWSKEANCLVYPSFKDLNKVQSYAETQLRLIRNSDGHPYEDMSDAEIISAFRNKRLSDSDALLAKSAKKQIDKANEIMLMTGSNSLYLALGTLSWIEQSDFRGTKSSTEWCAPLYLYPVILDGGKGRPWTLSRDPKSQITPNFCLHEKLKRPPYNLDLQELVNPEKEALGIDLDKMIGAIRQRLATAKLDNFSLDSRAVLGAFNYSSFRLWKDLRDDWGLMAEISPVFKHLAYTSNVEFTGNPPLPNPSLEPLLPIAADDSQRGAVQLALDGQSFKLEGPPGTGKSQTITNLLASCIAHNKKVLFVAEKQTALDAVKDRLDKTGLGTFSLNLHAKGDSDSKLRKNIATALNAAMNAKIDPANNEWSNVEHKLRVEKDALDRYRNSLHEDGVSGVSAWGANEQLLEVGEGLEVELPPDFVAKFVDLWPKVRDAVLDLDRTLELVPDTSRHEWRFSGLAESVDLVALTKAMNDLLKAAESIAISADATSLSAALTDDMLSMLGEVSDLASGEFRPPSHLVSKNYGAGSVADEFDSAVERVIDEAQVLKSSVGANIHIVAPSFLERNDHDELRALLKKNDSDALRAQMEHVEREWQEIARLAVGLPDIEAQKVISRLAISTVLELLTSAESSSDIAEFDLFVQLLRSIQMRAREHENSVASEILERTDLPDLEFRAKEASEAGAFARGRKVKALRELLGPIARGSDDRLLVNSAIQMIAITRELRELTQRMSIRFPEVQLTGVRFWNQEELDRLAGELLRSRVVKLRELNVLVSPPADDRQFLAAVRILATISPLVEAQLEKVKAFLPTVDPLTLHPWVAGEFERFRSNVSDYRNYEVVSKLGRDALNADAAKVINAAKVMLDNVDRVKSVRGMLNADVFPEFAERFDPWDATSINRIDDAAQQISKALRALEGRGDAVLRALFGDSSTTGVSESLTGLAVAWKSFKSNVPIESVDEWSGGRSVVELVRDEIPTLLADAGQYNSYLKFNRWQELQRSVAEFKRLGLAKSMPSLLARELSPSEFLVRVHRSALSHALRVRMEDGNLDRFDRKIHEQRIAAFEKALAEARALLGRRIPGLASSRYQTRKLPSGAPRGATQDLLKGLTPKKGDKTPIRELITKYGSALAEAMPCFLMSPDSVAALLPVGSIEFDLVIFDEASQIRTPSAIGALGRGKAGVVVGDSRQMPPSSAFSSNAGSFVIDDDEDEDEPDNAEIEGEEEQDGEGKLIAVAARDAESILSEFEDSKLPERQLLCHYRSKDEVLIAFSNTFIYPEPMLTFPSPAGLQSTSLRFVHVADGSFERDKSAKPYEFQSSSGLTKLSRLRTNLKEAELIVQEVLARLRDPRRQARRLADPERMAESIIVVTFNLPQMNLISELIKSADYQLAEIAMNPEIIDEDTERPPQLKVRNVENVQGDEAETVIFSVAFSKKPDGKFSPSFGPITQIGGERRLNVAVTRAHREMIVYASFLPEEMSQGGRELKFEAKMVQNFLKLAQKGADSVGDVGIAVRSSRHIEEIAREIRALGFEVYTQLGLSSLRVDLALRRPGSQRWEIAVMVDDTCWADRGSAFQREILPRQVLPAMGWKRVFRIWMPSWKNSKDEILDELRVLLNIDFNDEIVEESVVQSTLETPEIDETENSDNGLNSNLDSGPDAISVKSVEVGDDDFELFVPYQGVGRGGKAMLYDLEKDFRAKAAVMEVVTAVLEVEAPIEANRFARAVCRAFDFGRMTPDRSEQIVGLVPEGHVHTDVVGRFIWREERQWENWTRYRTSNGDPSKKPFETRKPEEVSAFEYQNALVDFVQRSHSMTQDDLVVELARCFGTRRVYDPTKLMIRTVLDDAVQKGLVKFDGDMYAPTN